MAVFPDLTKYYRLTFNSDGTGGSFNFCINIAYGLSDVDFIGDGSEFAGYTTGLAQLQAIAAGIASAIESYAAPSWDNITLVSIEAQPIPEPVTLYP